MTEFNVHNQFSFYERLRGSADGHTMMPVVEALNMRIDDFLRDMHSLEANQGLRHRVRRRLSIPTPGFRMFYQGVTPSSTTTQFFIEPLALIEDVNEPDCDELDSLKNGKEERRRQDLAFIEGMGEKIVDVFVNGGADAITGDHINGLKDRLTSLGNRNVESGGGSANRTSMYAVEWSDAGFFGIYPPGYVKGSRYGIIVRNEGEVDARDDDGKVYRAYRTRFKAWLGCGCADELKIARIPNIDITKEFDEDKLIKILNICHFQRGRTRIYCNEYMRAQIEIRAKDKGNILWSTSEVFGREVVTFSGGAALRTIDSAILGKNEDAVG